MDAYPLISVVTPSFNQGRFIDRCIRSVLGQHYPHFEHIVYDNCSTDGTLDILRRYPHLTWVSEPDRGQSHAVNKGFWRAHGEIIAWLNADDAYEPGAFQIAARELRADADVRAIAGRVQVVDAAGHVLRTSTPNVATLDRMIEFWQRGFCLEQCGVLFRREVLAQIGGLDERLHYAMDYEFFLRLVASQPLKLVDAVLARFTLQPESKTGRLRHSAAFVAERERASAAWWGPRDTAQYRRRRREGRQHLAEHFANVILHAHRDRDVVDWGAVRNLIRLRPRRILDRHLFGVLVERSLGPAAAGYLRRAFVKLASPR